MRRPRSLPMRAATVASSLALSLGLIVPTAATGFSVDGKCLGLMVQTGTIELTPGYWSVGGHSLSVRYVSPLWGADDTVGPADFTVADGTGVYSGQVRVDQDGLFRGYLEVPDQTIDPAQDTVLWAAWFWDMTGLFGGGPTTMQDIKAEIAAGAVIKFSIDGGEWLDASMGPVEAVCANGMLGGGNDAPLYHRTWGPSS